LRWCGFALLDTIHSPSAGGFNWLVLARGLHEQGDLDAVVDV
jgi:hypothetical protein